MGEIMNKTEAGFMDARKKYGKEAEAALREYHSIIGEPYYRWFANLYVPRKCICDNYDEEGNRVCLLPRDENGKCLCTGGGFYFSNSARDNEQFEIDIESTAQACFFIQNTGFLDNYDRDYKKGFPKQMQLDIAAFAKSLQDPEDGYFYHPQWGKDIIPSRQGRDLSWATSLLQDLADKPLYDTPNGYKGTLGAPLGLKNAGMRKDAAVWSPRLVTLEAFKEYLASKDLPHKSYPVGNEVFSQSSQIIARDKQMWIEQNPGADPDSYDKHHPAKGGFLEVLREFFDRHRNPQNGLWQNETCYYSVNGLMKISGGYNSVGFQLDYAEEAFDSAVKMALLDPETPDCQGEIAKGSVDVFNPWVCINSILTNLKTYGDTELYEKLKEKLGKNAAELIRVTKEKAKKFKKPDGSFGYRHGGVGGLSQMVPVAIEGTLEGDINGGNIATNGIWRNMCATLELTIPLFDETDYQKLMEIIKTNCDYK